MTTSPDLVLVDGSSYVYRAFHALPPLSNSRGEPTGAVLGVLNMLLKFVKEYQPKCIAVVFDASGKTFRDDLFAEYKANRPPMPNDLRSQIEPLLSIIRAQGLPILRIEGVEADDVIGTLACRAAKAGKSVLISTGDKDMAQLVDGSITLINTMSNSVLDRAGVKAKFDVFPEQIIDYLALVGDSSDNIPGIEKVGPKTAAKWLGQYQTLDNLVANAAQISGKVGENLRAGLQTLELSKKLATIHTELDLPLAHDQLTPTEPDTGQLRELYTRYEFRSLLKQLDGGAPDAGPEQAGAGWGRRGGAATGAGAGGAQGAAVGAGIGAGAGGPAAAGATGAAAGAGGGAGQGTVAAGNQLHIAPGRLPPGAPSPLEGVQRKYETITQWEDLERWMELLRKADLFAFDTETTSLDYMKAEIVGVSFGLERGVAAYVPLRHDYAGAPEQLDRDKVLAALKPILEDPERGKIGHHLKYDAHVLANHDVELAGMRFDTMLESYVLNSVATRHDMDSTAACYLGIKTITYEDVAGKGAKQLTFNQVPVDKAAEYAAEDADITLCLHHTLWPQLGTFPQLKKLYEELEQPLVPVLLRMEHRGVLVDRELLRAQSREFATQLQELTLQARKEAGTEFNVDSPKQLQQILFEKLQIPVTRKTPTGQPSTAEDVLEELALSYPLPRIILEYRALAKLKSTYTDKLPELVDARTGRIHTSYHQAVAQTGRLSSADPNLQNIPVRRPEGRRIRQAFVAPPGYVLMAADYSQIELRIMAHLSGDEGLLSAFAEDRDVHEATAAEVFSVPLDSVTSDQRRTAKTINFGLIYGMSPFGLARQLGIDRGSAQRYVERYFARYPGVKRFMDDTRHSARETGFVETVYGRRLYLPDIRAGKAAARQYAERTAINAPMQGTAADIIKRAMISVDAWCQREDTPARLIMQVHDELVLEVRADAVNDVAAAIRERMTAAGELRVPLRVDIGTGANWDEAH
ncbi:MAG TPA: DNA polymerase I [Steroidobacteraceae bacterium]|nr:DNA polymerase I [Steroidobacteraceae bacterium]